MIKIKGNINRDIYTGDVWIDPNKIDVIYENSYRNSSNIRTSIISINGVIITGVSQEDVDRVLTYRLGDNREQQIKTVLDD
jgi:hypothetical protein